MNNATDVLHTRVFHVATSAVPYLVCFHSDVKGVRCTCKTLTHVERPPILQFDNINHRVRYRTYLHLGVVIWRYCTPICIYINVGAESWQIHFQTKKKLENSLKSYHCFNNNDNNNNNNNNNVLLTTHSTHFIYGYMASHIW